MLRFLAPTKQSAQTALIKVEVEGQSVYLYQQTIDAIHKKLNSLEYLANSDNKTFNTKSQSALKKFQEKNGLPATGFPDQKSLIMLLLGQVK